MKTLLFRANFKLFKVMLTSLLLVSLAWGFTNPFIKRSTKGLSQVSAEYSNSPYLVKLFHELKFLCKLDFLVPFLINLSGSFIYYITLGDSNLTLAVPISNSLTFALTALSGVVLGEDFGSRNTILGMILVIFGVLLCVTG